MTDKEFIQFSKSYFGELDYTKLSKEEYQRIFEKKESQRLLSMAESGKLDNIFNKLKLNKHFDGISLTFNGKVISTLPLNILNLLKSK